MPQLLTNPLFRGLAIAGFAFTLSACGDSSTESTSAPEAAEAMEAAAADAASSMTDMAESAESGFASAKLEAILMAQPEDVQARYVHRHPFETLEFFGIEPGMTVIEALPGGGWYSKLLIPYLGEEGTLIGADYSPALWPLFGFFSEERLKAKEVWPETWSAEARGWVEAGGASIDAFQWSSMPEGLAGQVDAVIFVRALHNLARFQSQGNFLTDAIAEAYSAVRPGGVVGVVQHLAPEEASDEWASGNAGYLKKSFVVATFEEAGFELEAESEININPADQPAEGDIVWRLPPTMMGTGDNEETAAAVRAIGESTRMTLLFRKPA